MADKSTIEFVFGESHEKKFSCGLWHLKLGPDLKKRHFVRWTTLVSKWSMVKLKEAKKSSGEAPANLSDIPHSITTLPSGDWGPTVRGLIYTVTVIASGYP